MCGIIGLITAEKYKSDAGDRGSFIQQGLIIDTVRGWDAAGIFGAEKGRQAKAAFVKRPGSGFNLQCYEEYNKLFAPDRIHEYKYLVGHNRSATQGGLGVEAAHPFQEGNITMVHNGSLHNTHTMPRSQSMCKAINDSHTIACNLAEYEPEDVLPFINGPFALVWHDAEDDSLNIARNPERPLFIARAAKNDTVYFASEGAMLYLLDERIGIGLQQIVSLNPYYWLKFTPGSIKPAVKPFEKYVYRPQTRQPPHVNYHQEWQGSLAQNHDLTPTSHPKMEKIDHRGTSRGTKTNDLTASDSLQYMLLEHEMYIEEMYDFIPQYAEEIIGKDGGKHYMVQGRVRRDPHAHGGPMGVVYGVSEAIWRSGSERVWTIRPCGIKYMENGAPIIICRFVKTTTVDESVEHTEIRTNTVHSGKLTEQEVVRPNGEIKLYEGPHGTWIPFAAWKRATAEGCIQCGRPINPSKANGVQWVNDRKDPLCPTCVTEYNTQHPLSPSDMN